MKFNLWVVLALSSLLVILIYLLSQNININKILLSNNEMISKIDVIDNIKKQKLDQNYQESCKKLFKKMRFPDKKLLFNPPLNKIPDELYSQFTDNGNMPVKRIYYFNDIYSDSSSDDKSIKGVIPKSTIDHWLTLIRQNKPLRYGDLSLKELMFIFSHAIKNKTITVIGTIDPWVESIAFELGASKVTTLEYTRKKYEIPQLEWFHVNDYLDEAINNNKFENFDNAASFSSIEHAGLGRFGDPLAPYGDVEAVQQVHCMIKKGGLFFLCLPTSDDDSSFIEFNAHRIYGSSRLKLLFKGWKLLASKKDTEGHQTIFVLEKI